MNETFRSPASAAWVGARAMGRWLALCALVGVLAGLAGAAFVTAVDWLSATVLEGPFRITLGHAGGEHGEPARAPSAWPWWLLPVVPAAGGMICGLLARWIGLGIRGGGTDTVLHAYHSGNTTVPLRVTIGKWIASVVTLGSGGSAGREGPMTLVGGGIGEAVGRAFSLGPRERRLLLLAGAGAGVGAVFRVPLGSALFAIEVLYRDGFEEEGIFPCLMASVCGYATFVAIHGTSLMFTLPPLGLVPLWVLPLFGLVGVAVAPAGHLFVMSLKLVSSAMQRLRIPTLWQPALGGLLVGMIGLIEPELLGIGYGWAQKVLSASTTDPLPLGAAGLFAAYALAKIGATALTVGSGGSGGTFAPSIVVGAFVGGAVGSIALAVFPDLPASRAAFALVGMGAFLGGIAHVPLAAVVLVCELVGNYQLLVPLMAGVGVAYLLLHRTTLYPVQAANPAASPARAGVIASEALAALRVQDLLPLRRSHPPVSATMPLGTLIGEFVDRRASLVVLAGEDGKPQQMVSLRVIRAVMQTSTLWPHLIAEDAGLPLVSLRLEDSLQAVMEKLVSSDCDELPVICDGQLVGMAGHEDIARLALREALNSFRRYPQN